eukprot:scpid89451/ scgid23665/ 
MSQLPTRRQSKEVQTCENNTEEDNTRDTQSTSHSQPGEMRTGGDQQATILEVTTSVSGRKRGRPPRKPLIKTTEESDTGRVTRRCVGRDESGPAGSAASEVTTRRLPSGKDESRAATSEVTKKDEKFQQSAIGDQESSVG